MNMNIEETLKNLNQFPLVEDFRREVENSRRRESLEIDQRLRGVYDYRQLPISPSMIKPAETSVIFNQEVFQKYQFLVEHAHLDSSSFHAPFIVLGRRVEKEGEEMIHMERLVHCTDYTGAVSKRELEIDYDVLLDVLENQDYNVCALCRTHVMYTEEERKRSTVSELSSQYIEKYNIREPEFNISLGELNEFSAIASVANNQGYEKEMYQMTIMPSGEVSLLGVSDDRYHKVENIVAFTGEDFQKVPVQSFDPKFARGKNIQKK